MNRFCSLSKRSPFIVVIIACALSACGNSPPLEVTFRQSLMDSAGLVLQVKNTERKHLSCIMTAENRTYEAKVTYEFSLGPNEHTEIGIVEAAWTFKTGESVTIQTEGFSDMSFRVP